jgi:hypothetical protein
VRIRKLLAATLVVAMVSTAALAVVVQREWTPTDLKQNPVEFSVTTEMQNDGLVHFKVIHKTATSRWVQANLVVKKGDTRIAETHFPAFVREDSTTYYFAISPEYLADSTLELAERGIGEAKGAGGRQPIPVPGGTDNVFQLKKFAPKLPTKKTVAPTK